jgi:hypothetical protein
VDPRGCLDVMEKTKFLTLPGFELQPLGLRKRNKRTWTSMPPVGFEPTIPVFKRAKTVHDLDHAATVIGSLQIITAGI